VSERTDLARQYGEYLRDRKFDEALAMLADDVTMTAPMMGTISGKAGIEQALQRMPAGGGGGNISWSDPVEEGDTVKSVAAGSPFGSFKFVVGFSADNKINKIDISMGA